ncbi:glycosyltransferase family 4 protein [uncultured Thiodictyon sp.]|nr:glycosyltransferase family 4 protein [uncultured Thiodictyon sp.]
MKICHLNTFDVQGGAARAMYRIHQGLVRAGADSVVYTPNKTVDDARVLQHRPHRTLPQKLLNRIRFSGVAREFGRYRKTRPAGLEQFSDDRTYHWRVLERQLPPADLYHLHWIAGFLDVGSFMPMVGKPVVWTLHDMYALTGGCHYAMDCDAYTHECGHCPQLGSCDARDLAHASWQRKARAYAHRSPTDLHIVAPSRWLQGVARQSRLLREFPVHCIPYGIDTAVFRPVAAEGLRSALGLLVEDRVVLFVADGVGNPRKGFQALIDALHGLETPQTMVALSIGPHPPRLQLPFRHIHVGAISSDGLLAALYSLADLSVVPSLADNLPNVALESLACGTPVVGFDAGGIPDMVRPGETGWLAPVGRVQELREALRVALADASTLRGYGQRCREVAEQEYTLGAQARAYAGLYAQVLGSA